MENVGLMATAVALGNGGGFALQALNHSVVKVALFLLAGNLLQDFGSKSLTDIRGLQTRRPGEALVLALAFVAVAGAPPFGSFLAEWQILSQAADAGRIGTVVVLCLGLAIAFIALIRHGAALVWGSPPDSLGEPRAARGQVIVPLAMVIAALGLGLALAPWLVAVAQGVS
jgi:hydrogenase-4 component F